MMISRNSRIISLAALILALHASLYSATGQDVVLMSEMHRAGWLFFGQAAMDSGYDPEADNLMIDVDWSRATWGVGGMFRLAKPMDGKQLESISLDVKTMNGTATKIHGGVATSDDANMAIKRYNAIDVTSEWQTIKLLIGDMKTDRPNRTSRNFSSDDWKRIEIVKILFTKPVAQEINTDRILIRNPRVVVKAGAVSEASAPELQQTVKPAVAAATLDAQLPGREADVSDYSLSDPIYAADLDEYGDDETYLAEEKVSVFRKVGTKIKQMATPSVPYTQEDIPAIDIYNETITSADSGAKRGMPAIDISNIYLQGAGKCRDKGAYLYANDLFEAAIQEDPDNTNAFRVYGDYLMGYRGLYEFAADQYRVVEDHIFANPENFDDEFKTTFNRSMTILHRDGKDGVPIIKAERFSLFVEPSFEHREVGTNHGAPLTMFEQLYGMKGVVSSQNALLTINGGSVPSKFTPFGSNPSLFTQQSRIIGPVLAAKPSPHQSKIDEAIGLRLKRRHTEDEYRAEFLLRFANPQAPYFRFAYSEIDIEPIGFNRFNPSEEWDGDIDSLTALVGKNFILSDYLDLNMEITFSDRTTKVDDHVSLSRITVEDSDTLLIEGTLTRYMGANTLKLKLGRSWSDIERRETGGADFADLDNRYLATIRYSMFSPAGKWDNPGRFRGRRSDHLEIGIQTAKRRFSQGSPPQSPGTGGTDIRDIKPHIAFERLGLVGGNLDLTFTANAFYREWTRAFAEGKYDAVQVGIIPTWVFIYKLYDEDFVRGPEFLSLSFPVSYTFDDKGGLFSRLSTSVKLENQWVMASGIRIVPTITVDHAYYPEIEEEDWGIFAKCALRY